MANTEGKKKTFEDAVEELEKIVSGIESGDISLEDSIEKYADGMKLIKSCRSILDKAESKIKILSDKDGSLEEDGDLPDLEA